jgi:hypothetical protein
MAVGPDKVQPAAIRLKARLFAYRCRMLSGLPGRCAAAAVFTGLDTTGFIDTLRVTARDGASVAVVYEA